LLENKRRNVIDQPLKYVSKPGYILKGSAFQIMISLIKLTACLIVSTGHRATACNSLFRWCNTVVFHEVP